MIKKDLKIKLTKEQSDDIIESLLSGGDVSFHGDSKFFFVWSIKEKTKKNNLIGRSMKMLSHKIKPTQYFDLWIKTRYREKK